MSQRSPCNMIPLSNDLPYIDRRSNQPILGVKRKLWRMDDEHANEADTTFSAIRSAILQRDRYTCRFCGFRAAKYQEIHHFDDNHSNNDESNLLTVCNLCHFCHHIGMASTVGAGFLAPISNFTQVELIHIVRAIFVNDLISPAPIRDKLKSIYASFRQKADDFTRKSFEGEIGLNFIANKLSNASDEQYSNRTELLGDLLFVPTKDAFRSGQLEYYAANNRSHFNPENWKALSNQLLAK